MLEKTRKTPARKKSDPKSKTAAAPLPPAPQEKSPALPPAANPTGLGGERATQGSPAVAGPKTPITAEARWRMIAEAAYFKAQRRGFVGGDPKRDWADAEQEIDAWLLDRR